MLQPLLYTCAKAPALHMKDAEKECFLDQVKAVAKPTQQHKLTKESTDQSIQLQIPSKSMLSYLPNQTIACTISLSINHSFGTMYL